MIAKSVDPAREVVRIPKSGTTLIPVSLVIRDVDGRTFGPGIGDRAYGVNASLSCLRLNTSKSVKIVSKVPPEGLALENISPLVVQTVLVKCYSLLHLV